jgi:hypothetical protein
MQKDKFGRTPNSINYGNEFTPVEWDDTSVSGKTFLRGSYSDPCVIQCVDKTNKTIKWAKGNWSSRTSLVYGDDKLLNVGV